MCPPPDDLLPTNLSSAPHARRIFFRKNAFCCLQLAHESIAATLERREISLIRTYRAPGRSLAALLPLFIIANALRGCVATCCR